ncbi:MAG: Clp protease N-terminal domain-containing protein [Acidobacteriota bacterium]
MFERYDELARKAIFFARYECSQVGGVQITPEHLLLGVLREDSGLRELLSPDMANAVRAEILQLAGESTTNLPIGVDLPLSHETKRVLAFAAEEAERLKHKSIRTVHELLGLLKEPSPACEILGRHGVTLERVREFALANLRPGGDDDKARRDSLHALLDRLPAEALEVVDMLLGQMGAMEKGRLGVVGGSMGGHRYRLDYGDWVSSGRRMPQMPQGTSESRTELKRSFDGRDVSLIESVRLSEDRKTLFYSVDLKGPTKEHHWSVDLDLS